MIFFFENNSAISHTKNKLSDQLKKIEPVKRNKLRGILSLDVEKSVNLFEKLRSESSAIEIFNINEIIKSYKSKDDIIPDLFPIEPQTKENYFPLEPLKINKLLNLISIYVKNNFEKLVILINLLKKLNTDILSNNIEKSNFTIEEIYHKFGYSHILLRKSAFIFNHTKSEKNYVYNFLIECGLENNNLITNSVIHCYQDEQDFLSIKKSIMNLKDKGKSNIFTRNISRIPFNIFAKDIDTLEKIIESNLQSSLIDALLVLKVNYLIFNDLNIDSTIKKLFKIWDDGGITIDNISKFYLNNKNIDNNDKELYFYQHSSCWYENENIIKYRLLLDHFHDDLESEYLNLSPRILDIIHNWVGERKLTDIVGNKILSIHSNKELQELERNGCVSRSAIFNYILYKNNGEDFLSLEELYKLMSQTISLYRTIHVESLKKFGDLQTSKQARIICYLLLAKKSRNELFDFKLRTNLQSIIKSEFNSSIIDYIKSVREKSADVSYYIYEICTEQFLSSMVKIIPSTENVTEIRSSLHNWMGHETGDRAYFERARTINIDHQINKIRNTLDDNRIFVDPARYQEWINDELMHEINVILTSVLHKETKTVEEIPQLYHSIEKAYKNFCTNSTYGIASYIGRRIRHGSFKGHLYTSVIKSIEEDNNFDILATNMIFLKKWDDWKKNYSKYIDNILNENIHIESNEKRYGYIKPTFKSGNKHEIVIACITSILNEYLEKQSTITIPILITEYCWRIVEVDLRSISADLRKKKSIFIDNNFELIKDVIYPEHNRIFNEFSRMVNYQITHKLNEMCAWFKRPLGVSPKASLSLLYKAVIAEVKEREASFQKSEDDTIDDYEIELMGGAYHLLYDAFYIIIHNVAKHGKPNSHIKRSFEVIKDRKFNYLKITIESEIKEGENQDLLNAKLQRPSIYIPSNAYLVEGNSGISKLYNLEMDDYRFKIEEAICIDQKVIFTLTYQLEV
ncbi:hypothetical protein NRA33_16040 [Acinetobacter baumannii]|nr:hypothetical protein [Acinetobacter baumannii]HEM7135410.1 hypothetical protein [Acinetobacter baumannii]HEM7138346.1 hypothetical protein [Acinetobacter baumannii]